MQTSEENFERLYQRVFQVGQSVHQMREQSLKEPALFEKQTKKDGSPVSRADNYASAEITRSIKELFPNDIIISEEDETNVALYESLISSLANIWIIDPLDNTRGYLNGRDDYSILLTRLINGIPSHAAVFHPAQQSLVYASAGYGLMQAGTRLLVSQEYVFDNARRVGIYCDQFEFSNIKIAPIESTEAFIEVARGNIDVAFILMCGHQIWDIAFSVLFLQEAGGKITDQNGLQLQLNFLNPKHQWIVATNGLLHEDALKFLGANVDS